MKPWTDLTVTTAQDPNLSVKAASDYIPSLMGLSGASSHTRTKPSQYSRRTHPYISPLFADFSSLKDKDVKWHVTYGSVELLHGEQEEFVQVLVKQLGAEKLNVFIAPDAVHDHQLVFPDWKTTKDTFKVQAKWFEGKRTCCHQSLSPISS